MGESGLLGGVVGSFWLVSGCIVVFMFLVSLCSLFMSRIRSGLFLWIVDSLCCYISMLH